MERRLSSPSQEVVTSDPVRNPVEKAISSMNVCQICFDLSESGVRRICTPLCDALVCSTCIKDHFRSLVKATIFGFGTRMTCPIHVNRHVKDWENYFDPRDSIIKEAYSRAASSVSIQCGHCHKLTTLLEEGKKVDALADTLPDSLASRYAIGELSVSDFYNALRTMRGDNSSERLKENLPGVLRSLRDPERRASLLLRFLKDFPKIRTACCNASHCFSCAVMDFHEDKTCSQFQASRLAHEEVVPCPTCGTQLVKGDGCDLVVCPCGAKFKWSEGKKLVAKAQADLFEEKHRPNAPTRCAVVIYEAAVSNASHDSSTLNQAAAWALHYPEELCAARADLWRKLHPRFPAEEALHFQMVLRPSHPDHVLASDFRRLYPDQILHAKVARRKARAMQWDALFGNQAPVYAHMALVERKFTPIGLKKACDEWSSIPSNEQRLLSSGIEVYRRHAQAWDYLHGSPTGTADPAASKAFQYISSGCTSSLLSDTQQELLYDWIRVHEDGRLKTVQAEMWEQHSVSILELRENSPQLQREGRFMLALSFALDVEENLKVLPRKSLLLDLYKAFTALHGPALHELKLKRRSERIMSFQGNLPKPLVAKRALFLAPAADMERAMDTSTGTQNMFGNHSPLYNLPCEHCWRSPSWCQIWCEGIQRAARREVDKYRVAELLAALAWGHSNLEHLTLAWTAFSKGAVRGRRSPLIGGEVWRSTGSNRKSKRIPGVVAREFFQRLPMKRKIINPSDLEQNVLHRPDARASLLHGPAVKLNVR